MATDMPVGLLWENAYELRSFFIFWWILMKLADNSDMDKIPGQIGPTIAELRPLDCQNGHFLPCEQRNFFIFCWIFMKLADNNGTYKISDEFENGSDRTNDDRVMSPWLSVILVNTASHVFSLNKLSQSDALGKMSVKFETGSCGVKK